MFALSTTLVALSMAVSAQADIPLSPDARGDCGGTEGLVCRKAQVPGICHRTRAGDTFCATDEDSTRRAQAILNTRAQKARQELLWTLGGLTVFVSAIAAAIYLFKRRKPPPAPLE
jgi:hypothetical protein